MNLIKSQKMLTINRLFTSLLQKFIQQPDFYPIKHYHKRKRGKQQLDSL